MTLPKLTCGEESRSKISGKVSTPHRAARAQLERDDITPTDAIRKLMATQTYDLLLDPESYLHLESAEYILDMLDAEQRIDWNRWTEA